MNDLLERPFITVVIPVRNEVRFIADTLEQLRGQDYPKDRFEILVADGMSDDGTRDIVASIAAEDGRVRLLDNPKKRSSAGRNVGFRAGQGDHFVVVDGHCHIPDDQFLRNISECFEKSGAHCLGRPQPLDPPGLTPFQQSVALARASRLGHGEDSLIYGDFEGFASPVSNGAAYRREVFEKIGYVDEAFDACEDVEFNYRVEQAGFKAYTSPKLTVRYYPRENLSDLVGQMRRYGRGRTRLYRKHPALLSPSALVPACFAGGAAAFVALLGLGMTFGLSAFLSYVFFAMGLALLGYILLVSMATARICREHGRDHAWRLPFIFLAVHGGLGLGMLEELLAAGFKKHQFSNNCRKGKIRIAYLIDTIVSPTAGTEKQLLMLINNLDRRLFDPYLFVLKSSNWLEKEFDGCKLYVVNFTSFFDFKSYINLFKFANKVKNLKIDCIQTHFVDSNIIGVVVGKLSGVKLIVSSRRDQGYWYNRSYLFIYKFINLFVDKFVVNCMSTAKFCEKSEGIKKEKVKIIYNGIERDSFINPFYSKRDQVRSFLGIGSDKFVVCSVANLRFVKRIDIFMQAAGLIVKSFPNFIFVIVGDGDQREHLENMAISFGIEENVVFLGQRTDIPNILSACDMGVLSSDSESFSNALIEYMIAGLPVVATDVGGSSEIIENEVNGYLVPAGDYKSMADSILNLARKSNLEQIRRCNYNKAMQLFSKEKMVESFKELYVGGICK